jgi:ArsR family transcriptional regulator
MDNKSDLSYMETLYMALADKTRLRILDLMRDREVCVGTFTEVLGDSQPKISRHLAYLRSAGIVEARRDGKWMHYSIRWPDEPGGQELLRAALGWLSDDLSFERPQPDARKRVENRPVDSISSVEIEPVVIETAEETFETAHNELEEFLL